MERKKPEVGFRDIISDRLALRNYTDFCFRKYTTDTFAYLLRFMRSGEKENPFNCQPLPQNTTPLDVFINEARGDLFVDQLPVQIQSMFDDLALEEVTDIHRISKIERVGVEMIQLGKLSVNKIGEITRKKIDDVPVLKAMSRKDIAQLVWWRYALGVAARIYLARAIHQGVIEPIPYCGDICDQYWNEFDGEGGTLLGILARDKASGDQITTQTAQDLASFLNESSSVAHR